MSQRSKITLSVLAFLGLHTHACAAQDVAVKSQMVRDLKPVIATVQTTDQVPARTRIQGTVTSLLVHQGDAVKAGQKIAVIADAKLATQSRGAGAQIAAAQAALQNAQQNYNRATSLLASGDVTQARVDAARAAYDGALQNVRALQAGQQVITQQSGEGVVLAPRDGRVLSVPVVLGSVVMPGEAVATLGQGDYILRIEVPERHARFLKKGDDVYVGARALSTDAKSGALQPATIRLIYPEIVDGRIKADVTLEGGQDSYFVGERVQVYVPADERPAILVPSSAVFRRAGVDYVRLKGGVDAPVQTGQTRGQNIEVLSGLNNGDTVVVP